VQANIATGCDAAPQIQRELFAFPLFVMWDIRNRPAQSLVELVPAELGVVAPSPQLVQELDSLAQAVGATQLSGTPSLRTMLAAIPDGPRGKQALDRVARRVLGLALEQRQTRQALSDEGSTDSSPTTR
jgi:hypothetical protein